MMAAERQLLFAVLAFESELIDLVQLTSACRAWAEDKSQPLADLLVARDWLSNDDRVFVEKLVERKLAKHQGDPHVTLNAITRGDVCDAIKEVDDSDVQKSLSSWPSSGPVLIETIGETLTESAQPKSRYTWLSEVGKGGLGKVWLARDNELAREVALKEIKPGASAASQEAVRRLIKEAQITGQLQHPNIVPVYEVNRGGRPFYTMKLVKGETLTKAIRKHHDACRAGRAKESSRARQEAVANPGAVANQGEQRFLTGAAPGIPGLPTVPLNPLSLPRLLNVFVKVCDALAYAHSRGVIHRDLKPENIILGEYGEAIVLDWGLAKQVGSSEEESAPVVLTEDAISAATRAGATPGTLPYMAPEQARGRVDQMDQQTDIYGLGAILFEILTGEAPHKLRATDPHDADKTQIVNPVGRFAAYLTQIADDPTPLARERAPSVSPVLNAVCGKAMARSKSDRYASASALAEDIEHWLADDPVTAHRDSPLTTASRWVRKHRTWAMSGAAALALVAVVSSIAAVWINSARAKVVTAQQAEAKQLQIALSKEKLATAAQRTAEAAALAEKLAKEEEAKQRLLAEQETKRANEETRHGERLLYAAKMHLAQAAWENDRVGRLRELLTETQPRPGQSDLRRFEWHYWDRLVNSYLLRLDGRDSHKIIQSVAFSTDGKRLASKGVNVLGDEVVKIWNVSSGQEILTVKGHNNSVTSVAISADMKWLASASGDGTIKLWDAISGQELLHWNEPTTPFGVLTLSADGKRLASVSSDHLRVKVWDATNGQLTHTLQGHEIGVSLVTISADGKRLASADGDGTVKVWDTESGQELLTLKGHTSKVRSMTFSADEKRLVTVGNDFMAKLWDTSTGQSIHSFTARTAVFSSDGKLLASDSRGGGTVTVWDAANGKKTFTLDAVCVNGFSADGRRLVTVSSDGTLNLKVWDTTSGQEMHNLKRLACDGYGEAFSPDGKRRASINFDGTTVMVWDTTSSPIYPEPLTLKGNSFSVSSVAFSPNGKRLASGGVGNQSGTHSSEVKVWDTATGQETLTLKEQALIVTSVAFSPDGKRLAATLYAPGDMTIKVWDATSGQIVLTLTGGLGRVAFSPDGKQIVSAWHGIGGYASHAGGLVKVWDAASGQETLTLKTDNSVESAEQLVMNAEFSPDGKRLATASLNGAVTIWNTANGKKTFTLKADSVGGFSADGKRLVTASRDGTLNVWDATIGQETLTLKGHTGRGDAVVGFRVAFSPDGKRLASVFGELKLWDTTTGQEMLSLKAHTAPIVTVAFSPDGEWLASASSDQTVKVWDARPWTPELRAEREALSLIHFLRDQDKPQSAWLDAIAADQTISEPVRQRALQFAREWK